MTINYIKRIKREINYIKPHQEDDLEWYNEGLTLLENNKLKEAELKFKELIISQPEHQDGYHGLALTYEKLGQKDKALFFIKKVIEIAKLFLDKETLDELYGQALKQIQKMEEVPQSYKA